MKTLALHTDWSMEKVAAQKMLLYYSDAEGCYEIDFYHNLFSYWLVGNGQQYVQVGEDGSRPEDLWMFPSLASNNTPGTRINNNLRKLVASKSRSTKSSTESAITVPGMTLNHTGGSFRCHQPNLRDTTLHNEQCRCCVWS
jgi:hypothetical protein